MSRKKPKRNSPEGQTKAQTGQTKAQAGQTKAQAGQTKPQHGTAKSGGKTKPGTASTHHGAERESAAAIESASMPSAKTRTWLSLWVLIHLFAIFLSFTSVVETSSIHSSVSNLFYPYLRPAHFSADDRPVYLAYGETFEQPHVVQVTATPVRDLAAADAESSWRTVGPDRYPGLAVSDRVARWLSTAAMLADTEEPGMVAELLLPIAQRDPDVAAIRIVRLPTDLNAINAAAESPYVARVTRAGDMVSLIQLKETRLSSRAIPPRQESDP